ncbi:hypothetical protein [Nocardioides caricicola]|uniref:Uncharacterized protein n=1 Tax=Nocardioides caricicola TaxID=634770 RepID=A0ABW0MWL6_9ACTN
MHLRPPAARLLAAGGALALATVLSSCGFNYATDRVYTPAEGTNDRTTDVDVLGAVIVSGQEGSGTFIATFANNVQDDSSTVDAFAGAGDDADLEVEGFEPIEIRPGDMVNLADEGGIVVRGDFGPGDFVHVELTFGDGESIEMDVPATPPCDEFEGLDDSAEGSTETYDCEVAEPVGEHAEH